VKTGLSSTTLFVSSVLLVVKPAPHLTPTHVPSAPITEFYQQEEHVYSAHRHVLNVQTPLHVPAAREDIYWTVLAVCLLPQNAETTVLSVTKTEHATDVITGTH
jgi:hypothetical protein